MLKIKLISKNVNISQKILQIFARVVAGSYNQVIKADYGKRREYMREYI